MEEKNTLPGVAINWSDRKVIDTMKRTVAQGATDEEFAIFAELCRSSGLNPFKREVWLIKAGNRAQIMTGLNGYLTIANRHPQFDGMEISYEWDGPSLKAAICKVHRKDRKYPSTGIALMAEYKKDTPIWKNMPSVMLSKVAKCIAIREAFALELSGTYAEEEMPQNFSNTAVTSVQDMRTADSLEVKALWAYSISGVPEDKLSDAQGYLEEHGATWDDERGAWVAEKRIPKMQKFEVQA